MALDVDGTLTGVSGRPSRRTVSVLQRAAAQGVRIVLNSGRMTAALEAPARMLEQDVELLSYNGATAVGRLAEGRPVWFEYPLDLEVAREIVALARSRLLHLNYYLGARVYAEDTPYARPWLLRYHERTSSPYGLVENLETLTDRSPMKLLIFSPETVSQALEAELRPRFGRRATVVRSDPQYLEFMHPQVNKGTGLQQLCARMGIPLEQTMVLGDSSNDLPAFAVAGWAVAVRNAQPAVQAASDVVTQGSCDEDAVAEAVERFVLG